MFDIGFFELLVIAVVGLVVIGPERLPGAIRSGALWWGRVKRSLRETRSELERQIGADDIRRELHNEEVMRSLEALRKNSEQLEKEISNANQEVRKAVSSTAEVAPPAAEATPSATDDTPPQAEPERSVEPAHRDTTTGSDKKDV